jgi:putative iron-dependent peroxidase
VGPKYTAPATPADLFFHIRAKNSAVPFELMSQVMDRIKTQVTVLDETHGFRYFEGRAIIGFVDGTENPSALDTPDYAVIGDEDPRFINGSYAFAQMYHHDMDAWNKLKTEQQEAVIGRKKFTDVELEDEDKAENAHNVVSQDNEGGVEHKIVRMNVPFSNPAEGLNGTYFIGYARHWAVTKRMLEGMFTNSDRLLDFSTPVSGELFFIPSLSVLGKIADGEPF